MAGNNGTQHFCHNGKTFVYLGTFHGLIAKKPIPGRSVCVCVGMPGTSPCGIVSCAYRVAVVRGEVDQGDAFACIGVAMCMSSMCVYCSRH